MSTNIGIGFSSHANPEQAAKDAAFDSKTNLKQDWIDFALVFATIHYDPAKTLPVIKKILGNTRILGTSTAGLILSDSIEHRGLSVLTLASEDMQFGIGAVTDVQKQNPVPCGGTLAKNCVTDFGEHNRHCFLFFFDPKIDGITNTLRGIQGILGNVFPVVGAGSSDNFHFKDSYQIFGNKILQDSMAGILMGGHMNIGIGVKHGWKPLGKPRIIDEVSGNIIKSIDGNKAAGLYDEFFGKEADALRSTKLGQMAILYPLGIHVEGSDEYLIKNAVDILNDGSIVCQGTVPTGSRVHLMIGNKDSCREAAVHAAQDAKKNLTGGQDAKLIIVLNSMVRMKLLGRNAYEEIEIIKKVFGSKVPIFGMYSNGEVCPYQSGDRFKQPNLQNESIVILAIS